MKNLYITVLLFGCLGNLLYAGPLHDVAFHGDVEKVRALLFRGAEVNERKFDDEIPLHRAAASFAETDKVVTVAQLLLDHGADATAQRRDGVTPLHLAVSKPRNVAQLLLDRGADVNAQSRGGSTPLHWVATSGSHGDVAALLLGHGADVNANDSNGNTPLHNAFGACNVAVAILLLDHGADVDVINKDGRILLCWVFKNRGRETAMHFLSHGADPTVQNLKGEMLAFDESVKPEVRQLLLNEILKRAKAIALSARRMELPMPLVKEILYRAYPKLVDPERLKLAIERQRTK